MEKTERTEEHNNVENVAKDGENTDMKNEDTSNSGTNEADEEPMKVDGGLDADRLVVESERKDSSDYTSFNSETVSAEIDVSSEPPLDDDARNMVFEKGLQLDKDGKKTEALKCYLRCLVGLKESSRFALLPQCLRNIGDIYYGQDEYDKAISFIQAEKLYYESVLIDDSELQKRIDEVTAIGAGEGTDVNVDALRATEYEQLAKLCVDEKQPQLALEYAGKATKLRQKVYGDGHPLVQQSLDYFATVYAEVGKVHYTESMNKLETLADPSMSLEGTNNSSMTEPTSILRRRKISAGEREKKVRFDESQVSSERINEQEERCAKAVLLFLFFMLLLILIMLGCYLYCNFQPSSRCVNMQHTISDCVMKIKYWYFKLTSKDESNYD